MGNPRVGGYLLIVDSANGGDSVAQVHDQLSAIAPTLLSHCDDRTWQQLTTELGAATSREPAAVEVVAEYAERLADAAGRMTPPQGPVAALVFNGTSEVFRFWTTASAQGALPDDAGAREGVGTRGDRERFSGGRVPH